ncbi:hypothetical protein, partial [Porphyromonas endodontalis]
MTCLKGDIDFSSPEKNFVTSIRERSPSLVTMGNVFTTLSNEFERKELAMASPLRTTSDTLGHTSYTLLSSLVKRKRKGEDWI